MRQEKSHLKAIWYMLHHKDYSKPMKAQGNQYPKGSAHSSTHAPTRPTRLQTSGLGLIQQITLTTKERSMEFNMQVTFSETPTMLLKSPHKEGFAAQHGGTYYPYPTRGRCTPHTRNKIGTTTLDTHLTTTPPLIASKPAGLTTPNRQGRR